MNSVDKPNNIEELLNDIRTYLRISAATSLRTVASATINSQEKAKVYKKIHGGKSQKKIEAERGIPKQTISRWVNEFVEAGLVSPPNEYSTEYKALFTLRELGIKISDLAQRKKERPKNKARAENSKRSKISNG
jgi:hypothetical protein